MLGADAATAGTIGGITGSMFELSRRLLPTSMGRKILRSALESGPINQKTIGMLTAVANAADEAGNTGNEIDQLLKNRSKGRMRATPNYQTLESLGLR